MKERLCEDQAQDRTRAESVERFPGPVRDDRGATKGRQQEADEDELARVQQIHVVPPAPCSLVAENQQGNTEPQ